MKVTLLSFGKDKSKLFQPAAEEYISRLQHYVKFASNELPASTRSGVAAKDEEAEKIIKHVKPGDLLILLDERGSSLSTLEFAKVLEQYRNNSRDLVFAIGGDEGLSPSLHADAVLILSLSKMTMPHRLARVVFLEQLYRAFSVIKGEPYHKE